ncbi:MAG: DUF882 domain-containing protein [Polyangiaceae bacterium]
MSARVRTMFLVLPALFAPAVARADTTHVIARGHTLEAIAHRYHVPAKAIVDANHIKDPNHLKVGATLTIPGVEGPKTGAPGGKPGQPAKPAAPLTYAMRAKTPGVIHASRLATSEDFTVRVSDRRGRLSPTAVKTFEKLLSYPGNQTHPIDPRLITLVGIVSNHFGSRKLEVISGYRPYSPTQHTAHSNHNIGKAMDFRVVGVPNEVLRDYCRTLHNVGVGYYPNSTFVHLDVRAMPVFWIDYSKPGEAPRYNSPSVDADEGTSDVGEEVHAPSEPVTDTPPIPITLPTPIPMPMPAQAVPESNPTPSVQ